MHSIIATLKLHSVVNQHLTFVLCHWIIIASWSIKLLICFSLFLCVSFHSYLCEQRLNLMCRTRTGTRLSMRHCVIIHCPNCDNFKICRTSAKWSPGNLPRTQYLCIIYPAHYLTLLNINLGQNSLVNQSNTVSLLAENAQPWHN